MQAKSRKGAAKEIRTEVVTYALFRTTIQSFNFNINEVQNKASTTSNFINAVKRQRNLGLLIPLVNWIIGFASMLTIQRFLKFIPKKGGCK
jgi:hypothetical protein